MKNDLSIKFIEKLWELRNIVNQMNQCSKIESITLSKTAIDHICYDLAKYRHEISCPIDFSHMTQIPKSIFDIKIVEGK